MGDLLVMLDRHFAVVRSRSRGRCGRDGNSRLRLGGFFLWKKGLCVT